MLNIHNLCYCALFYIRKLSYLFYCCLLCFFKCKSRCVDKSQICDPPIFLPSVVLSRITGVCYCIWLETKIIDNKFC